MTNETFKDIDRPFGFIARTAIQTTALVLIQIVLFPIGILWYLAAVVFAAVYLTDLSHGPFVVWLVSTVFVAKLIDIDEAPNAKTQCHCQPNPRLPF